jgi:hypothetical protein
MGMLRLGDTFAEIAARGQLIALDERDTVEVVREGPRRSNRRY